MENTETATGEPKEESIRKLTSEIARGQLAVLGYQDILQELEAHFKGEGFTEELYKLLAPQMKIPPGQMEKNFYESIGRKMLRIPMPDDRANLITAAAFGVPFFQQSEQGGEIIVLSYKVAEPGERFIQTEFDPNKDSKHQIKLIPELERTELLAARLAFNNGFKGNFPDSLGIVAEMRKRGLITLPNESNPALTMSIRHPGKVPSAAASALSWAFPIRITYTKNP